MAADASRRSLARVVEAALHFFGVANVEQLEGLLDDTEQRAMLRNWLRSVHCPLRIGCSSGVGTSTSPAGSQHEPAHGEIC